MLPFLLKKLLKRNYRQEFLKCTFLPSELERGTEVLQFDVYCKATDQNFDCGCDRCAILRLDSLLRGVAQLIMCNACDRLLTWRKVDICKCRTLFINVACYL